MKSWAQKTAISNNRKRYGGCSAKCERLLATRRRSRYAQRMPIGERSVIEHCPPKRVRDFLDAWYHPGRMAIIVVGDFAEPAPDVAAKVPPPGKGAAITFSS